jgi:hypothetical protein
MYVTQKELVDYVFESTKFATASASVSLVPLHKLKLVSTMTYQFQK